MSQRATVLWRAEWLKRTESTASTPSHYLTEYFVKSLQAAGLEPTLLAPPGTERFLQDGFKFTMPLRRADVGLITQGYGLLSASLARLTGASTRLVLHTWKVPGIGGHRLTSRVMDRVLSHALQISDLVVLNSLAQQRQLLEKFPRAQTLWLPVATDTDWFSPGPPATDVLDRNHLSDGEFLLCVGDIDRDEKIPAELARQLGRKLVRVTRDPNTAARVQTQMTAMGFDDAVVLMKIPWTELRDLYRRCWALLTVPTVTFHPAGLTTLTEAMACGAAVLFPAGTTVDGYMDHGVDGLQFSTLDIDAILAVARSLQVPAYRAQIRTAARHRCERQLNVRSVVATFSAELITRGLGGGNS